MERRVKILAALLGLQVAAALALGWSGAQWSSAKGADTLLSFEPETIDSIALWGPEEEHIRLSKSGDNWQLPELDGFPADSGRVSQLLNRLQQLKTGPAVASSRDAQKRFKVSEDSFERKLTLKSGDKEVATVYLGTTPGMRRIHARASDADAIYRVELSASDLPLDREPWQDNTLLQFPKDELTELKVHGLQLTRAESEDESQWQAQGLKEGEQIDTDAVDELARILSNLRIGRVLDSDSDTIASLEEPQLELEVARRNGEVITYQLSQSAEDEQYVLKASSRPEYFHLPNFRAKTLLDSSKREALVKEDSADKEEEEAEEAAAKGEG